MKVVAVSPEAARVGLAAAADTVVAVPAEGLNEQALRAELAGNEQQIRRLQARSTQLAAALTYREANRQRAIRPDDDRVDQRADLEVQRSLTQQLGWSPSQAAQTLRTGRDLERLAATVGPLPTATSAQARPVIADVTRHLTGDQRDRAERILVEAARGQDPVASGRIARRLLADLDHEAAVAADEIAARFAA